MQINIIYDPSAANAPAGFQQAVQAAVQFFESAISSGITVNIVFGWGVVDGQPIDSGALGTSLTTLLDTPVGKFSFLNEAISPGAVTAADTLPNQLLQSTSLNSGAQFVPLAEARALGFSNEFTIPAGAIDGYVGLDSTSAFTFDPNNRAVSGKYDAVGVLEHEISEVLGRITGLGQPFPDGTKPYMPLDFFRYSAPGVPSLTPGDASISFDGGQHLSYPFNNSANGGDAGDWSQAVSGDSFEAFGAPGVEQSVSTVDLRVLEVLGYQMATPLDVVAYSNTYGGVSPDGSISLSGNNLTVSATAPTADAAAAFEYAQLDNKGQMQVSSATSDAWAAFDVSTFINEAGAAVTVSAAHQATGYFELNGGSFSNAGTIHVIGETAYGVVGATSFNNSGDLEVTATGTGQKGVAVDIGPSSQLTYINSGTIKGDYAFLVDLTPKVLDEAPVLILSSIHTIVINNSGTVVGDIVLAESFGQIHNSGSITGVIRFGDFDSVYDGAAGTQSGGIYLGQGTNTVTLGNDGETVFGGGFADTITGGSGADFIEIGRGTNTIDGGGGFNILTFADSDIGVTVDLGAGTATAGGVDTIKNIQEVIGSGFDDTLKAGSNAAELVGGGGHDALIGGAGADTLVAGSGGASMTGGSGPDTFVYSAGDHQAVITDFGQAGDHDVLKIYGYSGAQSVQQQGADTLVILSGTDSILLKNIQVSSLTGINLLYGAGSFPIQPAEPTAPPVFGTTAITFTQDLTVAPGETFNINTQGVGLTDAGLTATGHPHSFSNYGVVNVSTAAGDVTGIGTLYESQPTSAEITNESGGVVSVTNTSANGEAVGFGTGYLPPIVNAGSLNVTANGLAYGAFLDGLETLTNTSTGVVVVHSSHATAYGLELYVDNSATNNGTLSVSGVGSTYGIYVEQAQFSIIANNGSIQATATGSGAHSFGVVFKGFFANPRGPLDHLSLENSGVISADTAVSLAPYSGFNSTLHLTNSGTINGLIDLSLGAGEQQVTNTGHMTGLVQLGDGNDTFNGVGGTLSAGILLGAGMNSVTLGGDGETIFGGGGIDTIAGGGGNDVFEIPGGSSTIDGGAGFNTLSFAGSNSGVTVDLGAGVAVAGGIDAIHNIQQVVGSAYNDTLRAGSAGAELIGGGGVDTLIGGAGADTLVAGTRGGTLTGEGGADAFVYQAGDHQVVVTDFGQGGDHDVLRIYGYAGAQSVNQSGADTLITLSVGDSVLLRNVQASSLAPSEVVYSASAFTPPALAAAPTAQLFAEGPQQFNTWDSNWGDDHRITAGRIAGVGPDNTDIGLYCTETVVSGGGYVLGLFHNFGSVHVVGNSAAVAGLVLDPSAFNGINETDAALTVASPGGSATAIVAAGSNQTPFENEGLISATASGLAIGMSGGASSSLDGEPFQNTSTGTLLVVSTAGEAIGLDLYAGPSVENSGTIQVEASGVAYGVRSIASQGDGFAAGSILNDGTISITSLDPLAATYGIDVSSTNLSGQGLIVNEGTISARVAIRDENAGSGFESLKIINRGLINGDIDLGDSNSTFTTNNRGGSVGVTGNIQLANGSDTIDLRGGFLQGKIDIDPTQAGAAIKDVIYSGTNGGLVSLHAGDSNLNVSVTGGAGVTTVQFDIASTAAAWNEKGDGSWTVNGGADGTGTLVGVQQLRFTDKTVSLTGSNSPAAADDFYGNGVSDFLIQNTSGSVVFAEATNGQAAYTNVAGLGPEWKFVGAGDFLGEGHDQFLIENTSGAVDIGDYENSAIHFTQITGLGPEWKFVGAGDFLGEGHDQFLIENTAGAVDVADYTAGQIHFTQVAGLGPEWSFRGAGDFLGHGQSDFLIQNAAGVVAVGEVVSGQAQYTAIAGLGPEWTFKETGDFLGDGKDDFLIENTAGSVVIGEVVSGQAQYTAIAGLGPEWKFVGAGDYLGEGHDQFLIENSSGAIDIGDWSGGQVHFTNIAGLGPEWVFH